MPSIKGTEIECPKCGYSFPLTDAVLGPLRDQVSKEIEQEYQEKLGDERKKIEEDAVKQAREASDKRISELATLNEKIEKELKESRAEEIKFREERRQWKQKNEQSELELQRKMDEYADKYAAEYDEKQKLKDQQKDEQIKRMTKTIEDLKRQAEQSSQQAQGEALETTLEETLKICFPQDEITPVPKGIKGADVIQKVNGKLGVCCGTIIWESKNTKNWSGQWIDKLRENQQSEKADIAIIATAVLPDGVKYFDQIDGVWVAHWPIASKVADTMRMALIELHKSKQAVEAKDEKMEMLYEYFTGTQFKQRVDSIIRAFLKMKQELDQERTAMEKIWNRREKQLDVVLKGTTGLSGDLEAIAGATIPQIEILSLATQLEESVED